MLVFYGEATKAVNACIYVQGSKPLIQEFVHAFISVQDRK
jgi:hypothetical protein